MVVADDEVVQQFKEDLVDRGVDWNSVRAVAIKGADGELLLPIVLSRTGGSKC